METHSRHPAVADGDRASEGRRASAISTAIVSHFADYLGRGPTRARTSFGRDVVTVVLEETLTKAERRLVAEGRSDVVVNTRRVFQATMKDDMVASVEEIMGRRVIAFLSDTTTEPDVSVETFILDHQHDSPEPSA